MGVGSDPQRKQYPVKRDQCSTSTGWDTTVLQGSDCEFLHEYTDGGLCPIVVDDVLEGLDLTDDRMPCSFRVLGKLGRGSYSTVWLGRETNSGEYLALKVLRLEYSTLENSEMSILRKLRKLEVAFFHTHAITKDQFLCLGLKPRGCTLKERVNAEVDAPSDIPSLTILSKTLLLKVLDFHRKGISHGDISANNVSLGVHPDAFTSKNLYKTFEYDQKGEVILRNGPNMDKPPQRPGNLPEYVILRYGTPLLTDGQNMSLIDIIDFGKGFETPSKMNVLGTENYSAPELKRTGTNTATPKSDLWSLGCVFAYVPTYEHLFYDETILKRYLVADQEAQLSIIRSHLLGSFLHNEPKYCHLFARLIQSLVRVDPQQRDPEEATRILKQLEAWIPSK